MNTQFTLTTTNNNNMKQPQTPPPATPEAHDGTTDATRPPALIRLQKILVADDSESVRQTMFTALTYAGFDVYMVADGEAAWTELQREPYDLLITDHEMPQLAGLGLIERIRNAGMNLPVILASGSLTEEDTRNHRFLKIAAVIAKPFGLWDFIHSVRQALGTSLQTASAAKDQPGHSPRTHSTTHTGNAPAVQRHVLIADDDEAVRGSLAAVLQSEGYEVEEACDGLEAVSRAIKRKPDLVLLDLNMPNADGWTAFKQLDCVTPLLPVLVITARPNQYPEAVRVGVDAFMEKPLNIPILVKAVKQLTTEDEGRHVNRITQRDFVTQHLGSQAD
jgi:DNA-binding response OmpR family regulator